MRTGSRGDRPLIVRLNNALVPMRGHRDYPIQIGVAVPFRSPSPLGLPHDTAEQAALEAFEAALAAQLRERLAAVFAAVITGLGMREFVFYAQEGPDPEWIEMLGASFGLTVQLLVQPDPRWLVFRRLR